MAQTLVFLSLVVVQFCEAKLPPCPTTIPIPTTSTPGGCNTPLCKGLVGAGVGIAGLAAIGGIAAAVAMAITTTPKPTTTSTTPPPTTTPSAMPTTSFTVRARVNTLPASSDDGVRWLWPLLLGIIALCCCLACLGAVCWSLCRKKTAKRNAPLRGRTPAPPARQEEDFPLMRSFEQPMMPAPVSSPSYTYTAPYAMPTTLPQAPSYTLPPIVTRAAPVYEMAPPVVIENYPPAQAYTPLAFATPASYMPMAAPYAIGTTATPFHGASPFLFQ